MIKVKKILFLLVIALSGFFYGLSFAQNNLSLGIEFYYDAGKDVGSSTDIDFGKIIKDQEIENSESILDRLLNIFQLKNGEWYGDSGTSKVIFYVKWILNVALGLVSLISLILIIYGFYLMFFSKDEEGFATAKKVLKGVLIALVVIGLSWLIVSFIFDTQQTLATTG